jgi:hypothetical protein
MSKCENLMLTIYDSDEAAMRSRRLQAEVVGEREKVRILMARAGK